MPQLENELEPKLEEAWEIRLGCDVLVDATKISAAGVGVISAFIVLRRIEQIVGFSAELEPHPFADAEGLGEVDVELFERGAADARIADGPERSLEPRCGRCFDGAGCSGPCLRDERRAG